MISVIVPVFNVELYLHRCVDSLLKQSYKDFEIILVDDGSQDNSSSICDELERKYEKVFAYHKPNGGLASARNYGVQKANGEWVAFVDSDDYVTENYLTDLMNLIIKFNADMAITRVVLRNEGEVIVNKPKKFEDYVVTKENSFYEVYIGNHIGWSACGKLLKKQSVLKNPFPDGFYEDMASTYLFIGDCEKIAIGDYENNYKYIRREGSTTASVLNEKHYNVFKVCEILEQYIKDNFKNCDYYSVLLYQNAVLQLLNRLVMPWDKYCEIYIRYRNIFRKNFIKVLQKNDVAIKSKYYNFILCMTPRIFLIQSRVIMRLKGIKVW